MPWNRPTRDTLIGRAVADVEGELQNGASRVRNTLERALAIASGGLAHTQHGHLEFAARQLIIDTASDEFLVRWADIYLGENSRKAATRAELVILVTGTVASAPVPLGSTWTRADGVRFESTSAMVLPAIAPFEVLVPIQALDAGDEGNTVPGSTLALESAIPDIDADAVVQGSGSNPIGGGTDIERIADLLVRLLEHLQTPPKAGGPGDYVGWVKRLAGVTRAWELPHALGPSTVLVLFVLDTFDDEGLFTGTTFPDAGLETEATELLESLANVTAFPTAAAPLEVELNPEIRISPNTPEVQAAVTAQLQDMLLRQAGPARDLSGSTVYRWQLIQAIALAPGLSNHILDEPAADVVLVSSQLLTLGTPVYSEAT